MNDGSSILFTIAILFGVGFGIVRWMPRVRPLEERIRNCSIGLGIVSGFLFCLVPVGQFTQGSDVSSNVIFGVMGGAAAGFLWFFVIATMTFAYQYIIAPPFRLLGSWKRGLVERRARRAEERRRLREQREWERSGPEREQAQREADARKQADEQTKADAQRRRADARANCEFLYSLYAPEIGNRFSRNDLDAWIKKHMGDDQDPTIVEQRGEQLRRLIDHHREQVKPTPKFANIQELARWFQEQKAEIDTLPLDDKLKRAHLVNLNERYADLTTKLLESMQP